MPLKTWFQHDMNCRKKEGLSTLIKLGGNEAYGQFWRLQELYMEMQIHKDEMQDFFIINETTLVKELGINRRRMPKLIQLFHETCAIEFEKICKTIANVSYINWKVALPKSLNFIARRSQKNGHLELELELNKNKLDDGDLKNDIKEKLNTDIGITEKEYLLLPYKIKKKTKKNNGLYYRNHEKVTFK